MAQFARRARRRAARSRTAARTAEAPAPTNVPGVTDWQRGRTSPRARVVSAMGGCPASAGPFPIECHPGAALWMVSGRIAGIRPIPAAWPSVDARAGGLGEGPRRTISCVTSRCVDIREETGSCSRSRDLQPRRATGRREQRPGAATGSSDGVGGGRRGREGSGPARPTQPAKSRSTSWRPATSASTSSRVE